MQERYYALHPHNFVRLDKGKEEVSDNASQNVYTRAAETLDKWIAGGILTQDPEPALFPYFQEFRHPESGEIYTRKGFIGLTEVSDYSARVVHRHELTHSGPKKDRLQLTRHTRAHFGQLFMLYDDPTQAIDARLDHAAQGEPLVSAKDEYGVWHRLWRITEPRQIAGIQAAMADKKLLIADGHHRYETALAYSRENPTLAGADKAMMTFVNMRAPGLVVLATHRVLFGLPDFDAGRFREKASAVFDMEALDSPAALQQRMNGLPAEAAAVGVVCRGDSKGYLFKGRPADLERRLAGVSPAERTLDVVILHKVLVTEMLGVSEEDVRDLKSIRYVRGFDAAVDELRQGDGQIAFLLRPVQPLKVAEVAFSGGVMPQKSTDFYPKLLSGLTVYRFG
jgi:uncharacterized protein (DUF1015 family)